jgi:aquaporin Z
MLIGRIGFNLCEGLSNTIIYFRSLEEIRHERLLERLKTDRGDPATDMKTRRIGENFAVPPTICIAEFVGTALLVAVGLSVVILNFGSGSPVTELIPDPGLRRLMTGFLFGTTGGIIALSPLGKESGAHINPVVTLGFWLMGKIRGSHALQYVVAQLLGGIVGALPLIAWGQMGESVHYGATLPGSGYGIGAAAAGEVATTFCLIAGLFFFVRHRSLRRFTPLLFPLLYAVMVFIEAPVSGTSTNPARSLGPAVISGAWHGWWVYWIGPVLGTLLAVGIFRFTPLRKVEIEVAKLYHFEHDPHNVFSFHRGRYGKARSSGNIEGDGKVLMSRNFGNMTDENRSKKLFLQRPINC